MSRAEDIFGVLAHDERMIVFSVTDDGTIYTWNRSLTLQRWQVGDDGGFWELDIMTLDVEPRSYAAARLRAWRWHRGE